MSNEAVFKRGKKRLVSSSGGNAGLAVSYSARELKVPATIFVPSTTATFLRDKIKEDGAEVIVHGNVWAEANERAIEYVKMDEESELIHPFDHPEIWEGNSTMIDELVNQVPREPDVIICSCGGGGLLLGVLIGLKKNGWNKTKVIAVETEGASKLSQSLKKGEIVTLQSIDTIAKTLGASSVSVEAFQQAKDNNKVVSVVVTDKDTVHACINFTDHHRVLVEPSCGATLSVLYREDKSCLQEYMGPDKIIVAIVCGGSGINLDLLMKFKEAYSL
jgi:L-serine/L-threonine ammonia-lyase